MDKDTETAADAGVVVASNIVVRPSWTGDLTGFGLDPKTISVGVAVSLIRTTSGPR